MKSDDRAQLSIDYLAGMGFFLLTLSFVFQFTSGLFTPFYSNSDETSLVADRVSMMLVDSVLTDNKTSGVLNRDKTFDFLTNRLNTFNYTTSLQDLGLKGSYMSYDLNVSFESADGAGLKYSGGKPLTGTTNIGQTKRTVIFINSSGSRQTFIMGVRVW